MAATFVLKFIVFLLACVACFTLHNVFAVPIVLASASIGLLGSLIPFPKRFENHPNAAIYAGSFAGMCSSELITSFSELAIIAFIGSSLFLFGKNMFVGFGGRLGGLAFVSVALFVLTRQVLL